MRTNLFKKIIYLFIFILSFTSIMKNLYNTDNSLILESNTILQKLSLNKDSTDFYGITSSPTNFIFKLMIPISIFIYGLFSIYSSPGTTPLIIKLLLIILIIQYIYNTYKFNMQNNGNVCYTSHTSFLTYYSDKKIFYLTHIYKFLYLLGLIFIIVNYKSISSVLLYFLIGFFIQSLGFFIYEYTLDDKFTINNYEFKDITNNLKCAINNQLGLNIYILIITITIYLYNVNQV